MLAFDHLVLRPRDDRRVRPPLLVLLHGVSGNEAGLFERASGFDARFLVLSPRAPYPNGPGRYRWFDVALGPHGPVIAADEEAASRRQLLQFINDAVMAYGADPRQVFLFGFSQGATLAYSLLLTAPGRLRGAVLNAGRVLPDIAPLAAAAPALRHLTLLIQHGRDDPVIPLARGLAARDLFAELGVALGYREYPVGHRLSDDMLLEGASFLTAQLNRTLPHAAAR